MTLDEFNRLDAAAAARALAGCCAASRWVEDMLARRPFGERPSLLDAARAAWAGTGERDWLEAFEAHPRIGDIDSLREKYAATRDMAAGEQGGVHGADAQTLAELARFNEAYLDKFGFIFIVFASGKSAGEMLALIRSRINNSREQELANAAAEQLEITLLRLGALVS